MYELQRAPDDSKSLTYAIARDEVPTAGAVESHLDTPEANAARNVVCVDVEALCWLIILTCA